MNFYGFCFACVALVIVSSLPADSRPHGAINITAMNRFQTQIYTALTILTLKTGVAHSTYASSHGLGHSGSLVDLSRFFVDSPPPTHKWTCLTPSQRFNKCVRTLKAFMAPLKVVVDNERQRAKATGDSHTFNVINELRMIWLQDTYLAMGAMANHSNVVLDNSPKIVSIKALDYEIQKAISGWLHQSKSPTVLRNYAVLESLLLLLVRDKLHDICDVYPAETCPTRTGSV